MQRVPAADRLHQPQLLEVGDVAQVPGQGAEDRRVDAVQLLVGQRLDEPESSPSRLGSGAPRSHPSGGPGPGLRWRQANALVIGPAGEDIEWRADEDRERERLVAGGASGLGAATARALHEAGAKLVIADLNADKGQALASELGERASFVEANVMEPEPVQAAVEAAASAEGGLRISVCCAGIGWAQRTAGKQGPHDLEIFHNVLKVNLIGTFNVLRLAAAAMVDNDPDPAASGASASTPPRSRPSTGRSGRSPTRPQRGASSASPCPRPAIWPAGGCEW